jgi:hypothetical protein
MRISNCFGFAYHELGIITEEKVCDCPTEEELYGKFDPIDDESLADAVAIIAPLNGEMVAIHVAVLDNKKDFIKHKKGHLDPCLEPLEKGLENYLRDHKDSKLVFLKLKQK